MNKKTENREMRRKGLANLLLDFFFPDYDELLLFLYSVICILFIVFNTGSFWPSIVYDFGQGGFKTILLDLVTIAGLLYIILLPVYHAFARRKKFKWEKWLLLHVIILVNYIVAWNAYEYVKAGAVGWEWVFPAVNALLATLMALGVWFHLVSLDKISDEPAATGSLILSGLLVTGLFLLCRLVWHTHWAVTFSICIFYATLVNRIVFLALYAAWNLLRKPTPERSS